MFNSSCLYGVVMSSRCVCELLPSIMYLHPTYLHEGKKIILGVDYLHLEKNTIAAGKEEEK